MREWKPGDVAMVRTRTHGELVGIRTDAPVAAGTHEFFNTAGFSYATDAQLRPLVVIDPEDRAQVERLVELVAKGGGIDPVDLMTKGQRILQAALRSLVRPPPTCGAALNIKGEHIGCDKDPGHDDQVHANREHEAIWQGWPL